MSFKLLIIYGVLFSFSSNAQNLVWAKQLGGTINDEARTIVVDASGNVYTTGHFEGTADFDPGVGTYNLTSIGSYDVFISKLDASGNFVWAKQLGGTIGDYVNSIAVDASGNVYTTGYFEATADFDPGTGTYNLTSAGNSDVFISKLDASGNFVWAKQLGGTDYDIGFSIAVDATGNVYTTGYFIGTVDFDPGTGTYNLTPIGIYDVFINKLDASGNFVWAKQLGGTSTDLGYSIAVDASGNVYTTGYFEATADFDPGTGIYNLTSVAAQGVFISKLDASGNFVWAKQLGGTNYDFGRCIAVDASGNVYTTGYFQGTADFDPGSGTYNLTSAGSYDGFISKLDPSGNFVWAKQLAGASSVYGYSIAVDVSGNVYTYGSFQGTADFDSGTGTYNLTSAGSSDVFISKLDASGNFVWAKQLGGTSIDIGYSIAVDVLENVYTTGYFQGTSDFDPGTGTYNLNSAGGYDVFVHKMNQCVNTFGSDVQTACDSYTWIDGNTYTSNNNTATHTLINTGGCDSIVTLNLTINNSSTTSVNLTACDSYTWALNGTTYTTSGTYTHLGANGSGCPLTTTLNLTINNVNVGVANNSPTLVANQSGANYQWINCSDNSQIIGANSDSFTATENGSYAVIISMNGCTDTSTCEIIQNVGFEDYEKVNFQIYPNPFSTSTTLLFEDAQTNTQLTIIDVSGKILDNFIFSGKEMIINNKNWTSGVYFIQLITENNFVQTKKLILK